MQPKKVWDDAGTGGRPGSMWVVNAMGLLHVCEVYPRPHPNLPHKTNRYQSLLTFTKHY